MHNSLLERTSVSNLTAVLSVSLCVLMAHSTRFVCVTTDSTETCTMKHSDLLMKLADYLDTVDRNAFDMRSWGKDALYFATQMKEFQKLGVKWLTNDEEKPPANQFFYKNQPDLFGVVALFDIDMTEAEHLFGADERDEFGAYETNSFNGTQNRGSTENRQGEPPGAVANRIRSFVINYERIRQIKDNNRAA